MTGQHLTTLLSYKYYKMQQLQHSWFDPNLHVRHQQQQQLLLDSFDNMIDSKLTRRHMALFYLFTGVGIRSYLIIFKRVVV